MWLCALVIQNKVIRRKRTLRTWSNYNHQLPGRHLQEVLLLCQVLLHERGGVWLLPCSPGLSAFPSSGCPVCCLSTWFVCLTPSSAPPCLQSFYVNSFLNFGICFSFYLSHFIVKECQCTLILLILSYPGLVLNDIIKIDASLLLFKILSVCKFQPHLLVRCQNSSVAV